MKDVVIDRCLNREKDVLDKLQSLRMILMTEDMTKEFHRVLRKSRVLHGESMSLTKREKFFENAALIVQGGL